jgi:hypothetical protein
MAGLERRRSAYICRVEKEAMRGLAIVLALAVLAASPAHAGECNAACRLQAEATARAVEKLAQEQARIERERENAEWRHDVFRRYQDRYQRR